MPERDKHDVIVIGAGPAGAEAALAAAGGGADALCLAINLDTVGFPPGSPLLAADAGDPRRTLLSELGPAGAALPRLLETTGIAGPEPGRVVADRRQLGLAYKERLETTAGVELRQALVVSAEATPTGWQVAGRFGERFDCRVLIVAAGTFLQGRLWEAGVESGGGRRGEIPANALAKSLQNMGIHMVEAEARAAARLDGRQLPRTGELLADDSRLGEVYGAADAATAGAPAEAWATRPPVRVRHLMLAAGQVSAALESVHCPGLYFAGRAAGGRGYVEAAALGTLAGRRAAVDAAGLQAGEKEAGAPAAAALEVLINKMKVGSILCQDVAASANRPVSARGAE